MDRNSLYFLAFAAAMTGCAGVPDQVPEAPARTAQRPQHMDARAEALLQALLALGIDYRPGGNSPALGFDCSGLVAHVFREAYGIRLPQSARAQSEMGAPVGAGELRAGDLVFYNTLGSPFSHVGIYLGDGRFVHAPKPGAKVRMEKTGSPYWRNRFNGARRIHPEL